ncbi:MAG: glycoside hydrolase family 16 protein [Cyclobacteriaceae bacterium]|nr:glycoside hydrolase family 16 protein [Cyclobacteriaceae bacterium]
MNKLIRLDRLSLCLIGLGLLFSCNEKAADSSDGYELVWSDEFDEDSVNLDNWSFVLWDAGRVNNEWQKYVEDTAYYKLEDGKLQIKAVKTGENEKGGYTSTRLNSAGKKEFKYGRIEFRAKMPQGRGTWPALWMLGSNHDSIRWPKCGEIDIMEYVGYAPDTTHNNVHTKYQYGVTDFHGTIPTPTAEEEFHNYGMTWTSDSIKFYLDTPDNVTNVYAPEVKTEDNWPFDQPFYLIMNFAVGGAWGGKHGVDDSVFPQEMVVDYVRVYQLK